MWSDCNHHPFYPFILAFGIGAGVIGLLVGGIVTVFAGIGLCFSAAPVGILLSDWEALLRAKGLWDWFYCLGAQQTFTQTVE